MGRVCSYTTTNNESGRERAGEIGQAHSPNECNHAAIVRCSEALAPVSCSAVPTYDYRCERTGEMFELWQSFSDDALTICPQVHDGESNACGAGVRKVFSKVGIAFKGDGFYKNDHGSTSKPSSGESSSSSSSSSSDSSSSGDSSAKSDSSSTSSTPKSDSGSSGSSSTSSSSSSSD